MFDFNFQAFIGVGALHECANVALQEYRKCNLKSRITTLFKPQ